MQPFNQAMLWVDVVAHLPRLKSRPYLVATADSPSVVTTLADLGFRVVRVDLPDLAHDAEETLLVELTGRLDFAAEGAGSWAAFNDRLWDLLSADGEPPVAVVIEGLDQLLPADLHGFVRCVHNLLSMTEAVGLEHREADLQVEYFFIGEWAAVGR